MIIKIQYFPEATDVMDAEASVPEFDWVSLSFESAREKISLLERIADEALVKESNRLADETSEF